jgi:hypothetical protein
MERGDVTGARLRRRETSCGCEIVFFDLLKKPGEVPPDSGRGLLVGLVGSPGKYQEGV